MNKLVNWGRTTEAFDSFNPTLVPWFCFRLPLVEEIITNYTRKARECKTKYPTACTDSPRRMKEYWQQHPAKWYNSWNPSSHFSSMGSPPVMWRRWGPLKEICHGYLQVINRILDVQFWVPSILYMMPEATKEGAVCWEQLLWYWDPKLFSQLRVRHIPPGLHPMCLLKHSIESLEALPKCCFGYPWWKTTTDMETFIS